MPQIPIEKHCSSKAGRRWPLVVPARHMAVSQGAPQKHASPRDKPIYLTLAPKSQNNALSTNNHALKNKQKERGWYFPNTFHFLEM